MLLTEKQQEIMSSNGHLLVTGGPGSGKTTISIFKAVQLVERDLCQCQKILFLSFARATVSRVIEAIEYEQQIPREQKNRIDVETYHSFFWRILKTHGYLVGLPRRLFILTPPNEAISLSAIRSRYAVESKLLDSEKAEKREKEVAERIHLACEEGQVCFDLFAKYTGDILHGSKRIRKLIAIMYPVIILDEFQDTNDEQWRIVQAFGDNSILLALADPEQSIYGWLGANPERLNHFKATFNPTEVNLSTDNHRSEGTDIVVFGNDVLKGKFREKPYLGIEILFYQPNDSMAYSCLVTTTYKARKRLVDNNRKNWSLAILVPTKKMMRIVSDTFRSPPAGMKEIQHIAAIDMEAVILGAELIAFLMQPETGDQHFEQFINLLRNYFYGKGGDTPTKGDLKEAQNIHKAYNEWRDQQTEGKAIRRNSILVKILDVYNSTRELNLTGDPDKDWLSIRQILEHGQCPRLNGVAVEVKNLRLLGRGSQLRQELSQDWRNNGVYANALAITQQAFIKEHFSSNSKPETGVVVMNMHKSKGKQFDEVIIFEGWPKVAKGKIVANPDRIVKANLPIYADDQACQNFRVSITRGKTQTTILTPKNDPCILLSQRI